MQKFQNTNTTRTKYNLPKCKCNKIQTQQNTKKCILNFVLFFFGAFVFCYICILIIFILSSGILLCLYFGIFAFCSICILLHLYFVTLAFWQFVFCPFYFVFCNFCILSCLYFISFVFWCCILFCFYYGTFVF